MTTTAEYNTGVKIVRAIIEENGLSHITQADFGNAVWQYECHAPESHISEWLVEREVKRIEEKLT